MLRVALCMLFLRTVLSLSCNATDDCSPSVCEDAFCVHARCEYIAIDGCTEEEEEEADPCAALDCGVHGRCLSVVGHCQCDKGWTGPRCAIPSCSGTGVWSPTHGVCECAAGWEGVQCERCATPAEGLMSICVTTDGGTVWMFRQMATVLARARLSSGEAMIPGTHNLDCDCTPAKSRRVSLHEDTANCEAVLESAASVLRRTRNGGMAYVNGHRWDEPQVGRRDAAQRTNATTVAPSVSPIDQFSKHYYNSHRHDEIVSALPFILLAIIIFPVVMFFMWRTLRRPRPTYEL